MHISLIDYVILGIYVTFVITIGIALKRQIINSDDFFLSGRSIPSWITGLAFLSANLGAVEVMGMAANGAEYGIMTAHFYWIGAIPAMVFLAIFIMPFYYASGIRSVPEYLKLRFNEQVRTFNAFSFAVMTILMSGVNMYAMALVFKLLLNWSMTASIFASAFVVLAYVVLGGLTSSIYNEVLQFFLIVFGLLPLTLIGLANVGGWQKIITNLSPGLTHLWAFTNSSNNPMGIDWIGILSGLGLALSFGYWCTDFVVIQRALVAKDLAAAQRTPLIAAFPKILFPIFTVMPGILALMLIPNMGIIGQGYSYNMVMPLLMAKYYPSGMIGVGLTAMLASFMSGMAGNITAFNTIWTYDIYRTHLESKKVSNKSDKHYIWIGQIATVVCIAISILTAYWVMSFPSIMDYIQMICSFFHAPLFATFLLGIFWKRATPRAAFYGLLIGTSSAFIHFGLTQIGIITYPTIMAGNLWRSIIAFLVNLLVTIILSFFTEAKSSVELKGLVWGQLLQPKMEPLTWYKRPLPLAFTLIIIMFALNIIFW